MARQFESRYFLRGSDSDTPSSEIVGLQERIWRSITNLGQAGSSGRAPHVQACPSWQRSASVGAPPERTRSATFHSRRAPQDPPNAAKSRQSEYVSMDSRTEHHLNVLRATLLRSPRHYYALPRTYSARNVFRKWFSVCYLIVVGASANWFRIERLPPQIQEEYCYVQHCT
jgi:hypothetical protein